MLWGLFFMMRINELIRDGEIKFAGNAKLKINGTLSCHFGKRMKKGKQGFLQK